MFSCFIVSLLLLAIAVVSALTFILFDILMNVPISFKMPKYLAIFFLRRRIAMDLMSGDMEISFDPIYHQPMSICIQ